MPGTATIEREGERVALWVTATGVDLWTAWEEVRRLSSLPHVESVGEARGFRVEDITRVVAKAPAAGEAERWLRRRLPDECAISVGDAAGPNAVTVEARFARRGQTGFAERSGYARRPDGRVRLEAFELHAVEHCNLRCEHCCNMSPYLPASMLTAEEIGRTCREMARFVHADVFKIMGGEPLLHPEITDVLRAVRGSGISDVVRLFTNGLLLTKMGDTFWAALDQLTVSVYSSAPVKPEHLAEIRVRAKAFDVVLNVKPVDAFSEVMSARCETDAGQLQATYDRCWLRHRCMVVRGGVFYTCTRAAYQDEFRKQLLNGGVDDGERRAERDGIRLGGDDFGDRLLAYLNRPQPLHACGHCHGSDGPTVPHAQLSRRDVREGRMTRSRRP